MDPGFQRPWASYWPVEGGFTGHGSEGRTCQPYSGSDTGAVGSLSRLGSVCTLKQQQVWFPVSLHTYITACVRYTLWTHTLRAKTKFGGYQIPDGHCQTANSFLALPGLHHAGWACLRWEIPGSNKLWGFFTCLVEPPILFLNKATSPFLLVFFFFFFFPLKYLEGINYKKQDISWTFSFASQIQSFHSKLFITVHYSLNFQAP